jgi:hypothetical protein
MCPEIFMCHLYLLGICMLVCVPLSFSILKYLGEEL